MSMSESKEIGPFGEDAAFFYVENMLYTVRTTLTLLLSSLM